jgi:hypothetical protein
MVDRAHATLLRLDFMPLITLILSSSSRLFAALFAIRNAVSLLSSRAGAHGFFLAPLPSRYLNGLLRGPPKVAFLGTVSFRRVVEDSGSDYAGPGVQAKDDGGKFRWRTRCLSEEALLAFLRRGPSRRLGLGARL